MRIKKRYTALFAALAIAALCVVGGTLATPAPPEQLVKIVMPNAGGRVIFNHRQHAEDYGISCSSCHHTEIVSTNWDRDMHDLHAENFADSCQTCHHGPEIEPEPMSCYAVGCHERLDSHGTVQRSSQIPARDSVHTRCYSCHAHEDTFNEGLAGCASCHDMEPPADDLEYSHYSSCASCHTQPPLAAVLPDRMETYHKQCGDCHAEMSGPLVDQESNQCYQCHIR